MTVPHIISALLLSSMFTQIQLDYTAPLCISCLESMIENTPFQANTGSDRFHCQCILFVLYLLPIYVIALISKAAVVL